MLLFFVVLLLLIFLSAYIGNEVFFFFFLVLILMTSARPLFINIQRLALYEIISLHFYEYIFFIYQLRYVVTFFLDGNLYTANCQIDIIKQN